MTRLLFGRHHRGQGYPFSVTPKSLSLSWTRTGAFTLMAAESQREMRLGLSGGRGRRCDAHLSATLSYGAPRDNVTLSLGNLQVGTLTFESDANLNQVDLLRIVPALVTLVAPGGDTILGNPNVRKGRQGFKTSKVGICGCT